MKNLTALILVLTIGVLCLLFFGILDENKERKQDKRIQYLEYGLVYEGYKFCEQ